MPAAADHRPGVLARACWGKVGVYGDGSCPELRTHFHCRNCPVYSSAGAQLLDRPLPRDYRREWAEHFAQRKPVAAKLNTSVLLFRMGAEWLALPTLAIQEVAERRRIHSLPHRRQQGVILGVANIHGELVICASLGHFLGLEGMPSAGDLRVSCNRLLVAHWDGVRFLFPVHEIHGTHRFDLQDLKAPPFPSTKSHPSYTQGVFYWRQQPVGFLDADLLFPALNRSLL
jgi:chemotaxis-related protein WspD